MARLATATISQNTTLVKKIVIEVVELPPYEGIFSLSPEDAGELQDRESLQKAIGFILSQTLLSLEKIGEHDLTKMFTSRIDGHFGQGTTTIWPDNYREEDWSLALIRQKTHSKMLAKRYFSYWFFEMLGRTSDIEIKSFMDQTLDEETLSEFSLSHLWVFINHLPSGKKEREQVIQLVKRAYYSKELSDRFMAITLLSQPAIKQALAVLDPTFARPLFQLERAYYTELLENGIARKFAYAHLWRLGDRSRDYLWRLAL
jgi:hypothetical protein